jgi:hypothetical protein
MSQSDYPLASTSFIGARQNENVESRQRRSTHRREKALPGLPEIEPFLRN